MPFLRDLFGLIFSVNLSNCFNLEKLFYLGNEINSVSIPTNSKLPSSLFDVYILNTFHELHPTLSILRDCFQFTLDWPQERSYLLELSVTSKNSLACIVWK